MMKKMKKGRGERNKKGVVKKKTKGMNKSTEDCNDQEPADDFVMFSSDLENESSTEESVGNNCCKAEKRKYQHINQEPADNQSDSESNGKSKKIRTELDTSFIDPIADYFICDKCGITYYLKQHIGHDYILDITAYQLLSMY